MIPCACIIYHRAAELADPKAFPACPCKCHGGLTPAERKDLRLIAARACDDRGDMAPMLWDGKVIPWLEAINLDPALGL